MQIPKLYKEITLWAVFVAIFIWALSSPRNRPDPSTPEVYFREGAMYIRTKDDVKNIQIEIAETPEQQERGLMYRDHLPDGRGMLFIFSKEQNIKMWMKDTWISLDMIFIDKNYQIACITQETTPTSEDIITCDKPVKAVLELPAGYSARHHFAVGDSAMYDVPAP